MRIPWVWIVLSLAVCSGCRAVADVGRPASSIWFDERAHDSGLTFVHANGMSGRFYFHEIMGPGAALIDYDNDGDLDVFLVQGKGESAALSERLAVQPDGSRTLRFTDVTTQSGIRTTGYGMGVATGDFDNDGCVDLYLTNFGRNQLYRNNCDGTFSDVTRRAAARRDRVGACRRRSSTTTAMAGSICSWATTSRTASRRTRRVSASRDGRTTARRMRTGPNRTACTTTTTTAHSRTSRRPPGSPATSVQPSESSRTISTATDGSIFTSRMTAAKTSSGSISTTAPSATPDFCRALR